MTITNDTPANFDSVYEDTLEITPLRKALDDGLGLHTDEEQLERYCTVAMVAWMNPPLADLPVEELWTHFEWCILNCIAEGGAARETDDGRFVLDQGLPDVGESEVTEGNLRHWQWMHTILTDEVAAQRLIAATPAHVRQHGERMVDINHLDAIFHAEVQS